MGKYVRKSNRVRNKKNVSLKEADLTGVQFPKTKARKFEMRSKISFLVRQGYKKFLTTVVQVKDSEVSVPDLPPSGYDECKGYFCDCTKLEMRTGNYDCIRLYARKD